MGAHLGGRATVTFQASGCILPAQAGGLGAALPFLGPRTPPRLQLPPLHLVPLPPADPHLIPLLLPHSWLQHSASQRGCQVTFPKIPLASSLASQTSAQERRACACPSLTQEAPTHWAPCLPALPLLRTHQNSSVIQSPPNTHPKGVGLCGSGETVGSRVGGKQHRRLKKIHWTPDVTSPTSTTLMLPVFISYSTHGLKALATLWLALQTRPRSPGWAPRLWKLSLASCGSFNMTATLSKHLT